MKKIIYFITLISSSLFAYDSTANEICFYENTYYQGKESCYTQGNINYIGDEINDTFSSIKVPKGMKVEAFESPSFMGNKSTYDGNLLSLGNSFSDKISSLKVSEKILDIKTLLTTQTALTKQLSSNLASYFGKYKKIYLTLTDNYWIKNIVLPSNVSEGSIFNVRRDSTANVSIEINGSKMPLEKATNYGFIFKNGKWGSNLEATSDKLQYMIDAKSYQIGSILGKLDIKNSLNNNLLISVDNDMFRVDKNNNIIVKKSLEEEKTYDLKVTINDNIKTIYVDFKIKTVAQFEISGTPKTQTKLYQIYTFTPNVSRNDNLVFSIENKPNWATFDTTTGKLSGIPTTQEVYSNIVISALRNGVSKSLTSFNIEVLGKDNISLFSTATQGSTYASEIASKAIDNSLSTVNHTQCNNSVNWWQVEFPKEATIYEFDITSRLDRLDRFKNINVYLSNTPYVEGMNGVSPEKVLQSTDSAKSFVLEQPKNAKYLIVKKDAPSGDACLHMAEVKVYGALPQTPIIKFSKELFSINPDLAIGSVITKIDAKDYQGDNLTFETNNELFRVDENHNLLINGLLEKGKAYNLRVSVKDSSNYSAFADVIVYVNKNEVALRQTNLSLNSVLSQALLSALTKEKLADYFNQYESLNISLYNGYWTRDIILPDNVPNGTIFKIVTSAGYNSYVKTKDYNIYLEQRNKEYVFIYFDGKWELVNGLSNFLNYNLTSSNIDFDNITYKRVEISKDSTMEDIYITNGNSFDSATLIVSNNSNNNVKIHYGTNNNYILVKKSETANLYYENKTWKRKIVFSSSSQQTILNEVISKSDRLLELLEQYTTVEITLSNNFWIEEFFLPMAQIDREFIVENNSLETRVNFNSKIKSVKNNQKILFRQEETKWDYYEKMADYIEDQNIINNLYGSVSGMVQFAQVHTISPDQKVESLHLVGNRSAMLLFTPLQEIINPKVKIVLNENSENMETITLDLNNPSKLPSVVTPLDFQATFYKPNIAYNKNSWSIEIPKKWIQPNVKIYIQDGGFESLIENLVVGGASELYLHNIRLGMLTNYRELENDPENNDFEGSETLVKDYFNKVPVSKVQVGNFAPVHLDKVVMPNGTIYTTYSDSVGGVYDGDMRHIIAKSMVSGGINNANYGVNSSEPSEWQKALASQHTIHRAIGNYTNGVISHGLSGGNGMITLLGNTGNEFSHELGHSYGLGHYEGGMDKSTFNKSSPLGFDIFKEKFIPAFYFTMDTKSTKDNFYGYSFGYDAMAGGAPCTHESKYTINTPFSASKIQNHFESRAVFDINSTTGYRKWNSVSKKMEEANLATPKMLKQCSNVITLLGYYDPQNTLTSYLYNQFMGNCGNIYEDDSIKKDEIKNSPNSCYATVTYNGYEDTIHKLDNSRKIANNMNRLHINIDASKNPISATVTCSNQTIATTELLPFDSSKIQPKFTITSK